MYRLGICINYQYKGQCIFNLFAQNKNSSKN